MNNQRNYSYTKDSFKLLLLIGRACGMFPLQNMQFKKVSWSFCYCSFVWFLNLYGVLSAFKSCVKSNFEKNPSVQLIYCLNTLLNLTCYVNCARRWPVIMKIWRDIDDKMGSNYKNPKNLVRNINMIVLVYTIVSLVNQVVVPYYTIDQLIKSGKFPDHFTNFDIFEESILSIHSLSQKAIVHFSDLFIIIISIALNAKFRQINTKVRLNLKKMPLEFWQDIRQDYVILSQLMNKLMDEGLSYIILVSVGFNCFWIMKLCYNTLKVGVEIRNLTFLYSFGFLLFRFIAVLAFCTCVNHESKKASTLIQFSKLPEYNTEVIRLLQQIEFDAVYFSGCDLFRIKDGIFLSAETKAAITLLSLGDISQPSTSTSHLEDESKHLLKFPEQSCSKFVVARCNSGEPQKCFICAVKRRRKPMYIVQKDGKVQYICHVNCFNIFRQKYAHNSIFNWEAKNLADQTKTSYLVYQRKCIVCRKRINKRYAFSWNMRDFCSEICLSKSQKEIGSRCASCNSQVSLSLLYKYSMRFANDIKSLCSSECLTNFKMNARACSFCQNDMSHKLGDFLASVNDEGEIKEFCSGKCLLKYDRVVYKVPAEYEDGIKCSICATKINLTIEYDWYGTKEYFCNETCFTAFTTLGNIAASKCCMCEQYFPVEVLGNYTMFYNHIRYSFCSIICQNLYVATNQRIVSCAWCKTNRYNFDMIRRFSEDKAAVDVCSLNCLGLFQASTFEKNVCNFCYKNLQSTYDLTMPDETSRNFCSLNCAVSFNERLRESSSTGETSEAAQKKQIFVFQPINKQQDATLPVISNVQSLASNGRQSSRTSASQQTSDNNSVASITVKHHVVITPAPIPDQRNVAILCKVSQDHKSTSLKPVAAEKEVQTDKLEPEIAALPVPIPVYLPSPLPMYSVPEPIPVATPLPFPVPLLIPTTRNSFNGIMKDIKELDEKLPADPYQAEMLLMADLIANKDKEEEKTGGENHGSESKDANSLILGWMKESKDDDLLQVAFQMAEEIVGEDSNFEVDTTRLVINEEESVNEPKLVEIKSCEDMKIVIESQPDNESHLKYSIGVRAWVEWVNAKNKNLEKPFKNEILNLTRDELNHSLSLFVKEVKKPNGNEYAPDTVYYLCLGIQYYLFKHNRFENIFWDSHFQQFRDCLDQLAKKFCILYADSRYFVTRVEEEHLWETRQLGAYSPYVLLNTLLYFNTKFFYLTTVQEHMRVSFAHIMIDTNVNSKRRRSAKPKCSSNSVLRFYPPRNEGTAENSTRPKKRMYEQYGNSENPLRCPVRLYEFYLSKCPEGVGARDDIFYLQPERSCVADSPIWYSPSKVTKDELEKMLHKINMVKEICISLLGN